jgi:hypothetical protein
VQGTAEFHHQTTDLLPPQPAPVFDDTATLSTALDMIDPQLTLMELLVRHVLLRRELPPQIEINSIADGGVVDVARALSELPSASRITAQRVARCDPYNTPNCLPPKK